MKLLKQTMKPTTNHYVHILYISFINKNRNNKINNITFKFTNYEQVIQKLYQHIALNKYLYSQGTSMPIHESFYL